jgi:hypothetical protein
MISPTDSYAVLWHRGMWIAWLRGVGLPTPHVAALTGITVDEVRTCKVSRSPLRRVKYRLNLTPSRSIRNDTARRVRCLHGLGYGPADIARILVLTPTSVEDYLTRMAGSRVETRHRPRTACEQARLEQNRLRREEAQAVAADRARWRRSWSVQNAGVDECRLAPPADELVARQVDVVVEDTPTVQAPPADPWEGPYSPQATAKKRKAPITGY